jgi:hypothetical protein
MALDVESVLDGCVSEEEPFVRVVETVDENSPPDC